MTLKRNEEQSLPTEADLLNGRAMTDELVLSLLTFDGISIVPSLRLVSHCPFPWSGRTDIDGNIRDYTYIGGASHLQCDFSPPMVR